jgi:hypothetical protein
MKICRICKQPKPATREYFYRHPDTGDRLDGRCKECVSKANHAKRILKSGLPDPEFKGSGNKCPTLRYESHDPPRYCNICKQEIKRIINEDGVVIFDGRYHCSPCDHEWEAMGNEINGECLIFT